MLPVLTGRLYRAHAGDHDIRTKHPVNAHDVAEDFLVLPHPQRLVHILRKSVIDRAREILPPAIESTSGEQFVRAGETEFLSELGTNFVLAAVTAGVGKIRGAESATARQLGKQRIVFVVRM